ncbi:C2 and GRAM domain-containing protein At1g03370-like [Phragmites australis]|uniref:C2 and GRAM domain-containing protein At1g03370-like n=1 Tax=Phragmites australis TaxID=29695 RepID=UPI002D777F03|nr:C2 and GRAM domain-containing protein At1g03370-like [Phragmites australis]
MARPLAVGPSGAGPAEPRGRDAPMLLRVHVIEARGLRAIYPNGSSDPYVRLQLGRRRVRATTVVKRSLSPVWDEEFGFLVGDVAEELVVSVLNEDRFFSTDFLGRVRVPLAAIMETEDLSLGTAWYQLQPRTGGKFRRKRRGEICLKIYLSVRATICDDAHNALPQLIDDIASSSQRSVETNDSSLSAAASSLDLSACGGMDQASRSSADLLTQTIVEQRAPRIARSPSCVSTGQSILLEPEDDDSATANTSSVVEVMSRYFRKSADAAHSVTSDPLSIDQLRDAQMNSESLENGKNGTVPEVSLDELLKIMGSKDQIREMPGNLPGGVLVDQSYIIAPAEMNSLLFSPNSDFWPAVAEVQGTNGFQIEPWKHESNENCLKRTLTYTKAASKLVKSVKATEEQKYLKATGNSFAVLSCVSTPDVPCGTCFKVEILYCIMPGPQLPSEEQTTQLIVSWRLNFVQSTMLKGMIENGTKQGLAEGYSQFSEILSRKIKIVELDDANNKDKILASLQTQKESNWKLVARFLGTFAFIFSLSTALYIITHLHLAKPNMVQGGLEYFGIDLPDSIGEVVFCIILIVQGHNIFKVGRRFLHAWKQRGSDHGVKAHGDGWLLTIALIEGRDVVGAGTPGLPDPYVVFTCNGKRKTSSVKYQTSDPKWNEIFEFDAMDDPPARLDIVVYDSDGSLIETPIGQTEVNFVKNNLSDLGDMWLTLDGRFAQGHQPNLHLRIFLDNSRGTEVVMNYLEKMGKEIGKKMHLRSAQTNSAFRKLFSLPPEEFLIDDFTCHLKRKMPLQGRLFLSPRITGFYSNIFGRKTKFFFLWEDIDDIQVVPPKLATVGSPSLIIILCKDRGLEARHGAKTLDPQGRLKFHFQTFVSFNDAHRIIMALWKMRSSGLVQKGDMIDKEPELKELPCEEGSLLANEDVNMSEVYSVVLSVDVSALMEMFSGGSLEHKVMEKVGCVDYSPTEWELVNRNIYQRRISFRFDKTSSKYGGEATTTQQRYNLPNRNDWVIEEVMTLQGVLHEDYSSIQIKYHMISTPLRPNTCSIKVLLGIAWLKGTKNQKKATKNVMSNSTNRLREIFSEVEKEIASRKGAS